MKRFRAHQRYACCLLFAVSTTIVTLAAAQSLGSSDAGREERVEKSPVLPLYETELPLHASLAGWEVGPASGVAVAANGDIYVIQRGSKADPILVFDKHGQLLRSWGRGDFNLPHSIRLDGLGNVWAVDAGASKVIKYSTVGKKFLTISIHPVPDNGSPFHGVTDIAFAPYGGVFLTDGYANARILEYSATGKLLRQWGHPGSGPAAFHLPHAIQISESGVVYIADRENSRIEKFNLRGHFLGEIDGLGRCYSLKLDHGVLWASTSPLDQEPGAPGWLVKLDANSGTILGHIGIPEERAGHALDILPSGEPVVTAGNGLHIFHTR